MSYRNQNWCLWCPSCHTNGFGGVSTGVSQVSLLVSRYHLLWLLIEHHTWYNEVLADVTLRIAKIKLAKQIKLNPNKIRLIKSLS